MDLRQLHGSCGHGSYAIAAVIAQNSSCLFDIGQSSDPREEVLFIFTFPCRCGNI